MMVEEPEKLRTLPELNVLREDYCSQQAVDSAILFLQAHNPDLIRDLLRVEHWREHDYSEAAWAILDYLAEQNVDIVLPCWSENNPAILVGKMDLIHELTRRVRSAYGYPESAEPRGQPLAAGPDQPLPPLVHLELAECTRRSNHVTQDLVDRVLRIAYERRPDLWFAVAEEHRYVVILDATDQFRQLLRQVLVAEFGDEDSMWRSMDLYYEGLMRVYRMCGIELRT